MKLTKNKIVIAIILIIMFLVYLSSQKTPKETPKEVKEVPLKTVSASLVYNLVEDLDINMLTPRIEDLDHALKKMSGINRALENCATVHETAYNILDSTLFDSDTVILKQYIDYKNSIRASQKLTLDMYYSYYQHDFEPFNKSRKLLALTTIYKKSILNAMKRRVIYLTDTIGKTRIFNN